MKIADWVAESVTNDPRALQWFKEPECEERIRKAYRQLLAGYQIEPGQLLKTTRPVGPHERVSLVEVKGIHFYSICAHHFLPFFGTMSVKYLPGTKIIGLGKLPRLVDAYSRRFQIQEDLVKEIAHELMRSGGARGAEVRSEGRHMCMCSRGPSDPGAITETVYTVGTLVENRPAE
jgi:GTP cyclohydrolase I